MQGRNISEGFFLSEFGCIVTDDYLNACITQIVFNKFASRTECLDMSIIDLITFYEALADEAERQKKEVEKGNGK